MLLAAAGGLAAVSTAGATCSTKIRCRKRTPSSCWPARALERPLEAVDLYKEGYAPLIVLSPGRPEPGERLLRQRGIRFPTEAELQRDALIQLGIPATAVLATDGYVDNTAQEANLLRAMVQDPRLAARDHRHVEVPHAPRGVRLQARAGGHRRARW